MKKSELSTYSGKLKYRHGKELKNSDRTVGYFCLFTPVEIIEACGLIPVRIMEGGNHANEARGRNYIRNDSCSFCKAALGFLENSYYSYIAAGSSCDQIRRTQEIIKEKIGIPVFLFSNPRTFGKNSTTGLYRREIKWLTEELTEISGKRFSEKTLRKRVNKWNVLRRFLKQINNYRIDSSPIVTGTEMFDLTDTAYFLGPDRFLPEIPEINNIISKRKKYTDRPVRILLAGSMFTSDDRMIHNLTEENNRAVIVSDLVCTGSRWFNYLIKEDGNIFENVCDYYHLKMTCPYRRPNTPLYEFMDEQIAKSRPDGIIYRTLKFCHPWSFEVKTFKELFSLPLLHLDTDYSNSNVGQLRTRIFAFLEMIGEKKKIKS